MKCQQSLPDFQELEKVIKGERQPSRIHLMELDVNHEVVRFVTENVFEEKRASSAGRVSGILPKIKDRKAADTAELSRGERHWVEEGDGTIKNWNDLDRISWEIRVRLRKLGGQLYLGAELPGKNGRSPSLGSLRPGGSIA